MDEEERSQSDFLMDENGEDEIDEEYGEESMDEKNIESI